MPHPWRSYIAPRVGVDQIQSPPGDQHLDSEMCTYSLDTPFTLTNEMTQNPAITSPTPGTDSDESRKAIKGAEHHFLKMRNVNVALGDRIVLEDINLTIAAFEHVTILGPNGCGKSTLIRTMNCELYPIVQPGMEVSIFGRSRWNLTELRKHFGIVSDSHPGLYSTSKAPDTAGSNAGRTTGINAVIAGFFSASTLWPNLVVTEEMRHRAAEALERMDATRLANQPLGEMSAGEKRRIQIARALVHRPKQLLLDEPSNALDLAAQRSLREALLGLADQGIGLIMVTHHLGDILPQMERVILMRQGKIVADGKRQDPTHRPSPKQPVTNPSKNRPGRRLAPQLVTRSTLPYTPNQLTVLRQK